MSVATFIHRFTAGFLTSFATLLVSTAVAQSGHGYSNRQVATGYGMDGSYSGASSYGGNNGSSTAAESFLRGRAAMIEALVTITSVTARLKYFASMRELGIAKTISSKPRPCSRRRRCGRMPAFRNARTVRRAVPKVESFLPNVGQRFIARRINCRPAS